MSRKVIIQGSSRTDGNTKYFASVLAADITADIYDLKDFHISPFDYNFENAEDDFIPLVKELIEKYDIWIFASPVYWYSMSGTMKVFFDRITDLLTEHKTLGRKLRGKSLAVLSVSNDDDLTDCFVAPFELSAGYLGMHYLGHTHAYGDKDRSPLVKERLAKFAGKLKNENL